MNWRPRGISRAIALCCLILLPGATSVAADETPRTFAVKAGYWIPGEQVLRDVLGSGLSVGAAYSLPLRPGRWIDFEVLYWSGSGDLPTLIDETIPGGMTFRTSEVKLVPLALSLRAEATHIRGVQPFVLGGIDLTVVKEEVDIEQTPAGPNTSGTNSLSNAFLGVHFGGGAQYEVSPKAIVYLEIRFSIVNADTPDVNGLIGNGVSLGGLGIFAGVRIR